MKPLLRTFFRTLRVIIGPVVLAQEWLTRPRGVVRPPALQEAVDRQCKDLALYEFRTCPFCIKVRQEMRRLALPIERRDAQHEGPNREALMREGGRAKVPCLKITDPSGEDRWMYESGEIIAYLRERFASAR
jgi:glutaredoxin